MKTNTIEIGCIVDHGRDTAENTMVAVIDYAVSKGFKGGSFYPVRLIERLAPEEALEELIDLEDQAIDYLNENIAPDFHFYGNDGDAGAFGLWADVDGATNDLPTTEGADR